MLDRLPEALKADGSSLLGRAVRAARKTRGWTLADLSEAAGLDTGFLSKVERGLKAPSVSTVLNLSRALGVPVAQLFGEVVETSAIHVSRGQERGRSTKRGEAGYHLEPLTAGSSIGGLEGFLVYPPPTFSEEFRAEHAGEELLFVVTGAVEVRFADRVVALKEGDAVQFPGHLSHQVRRTSASASVLITVSRA